MLPNTVNCLEQCGQQNIVPYSFHQLGTMFSMYGTNMRFVQDRAEIKTCKMFYAVRYNKY